MQDSKVIVALIVFLLCLMASYKEFQGKRNHLVIVSEIVLGAVLASMVMV